MRFIETGSKILDAKLLNANIFAPKSFRLLSCKAFVSFQVVLNLISLAVFFDCFEMDFTMNYDKFLQKSMQKNAKNVQSGKFICSQSVRKLSEKGIFKE